MTGADQEPKPIIERVGQIVALAGSACIAFAVLFDFGYYWRIDLNIFSVLTLQDHIAQALAFIPFVLVSVLLSLCLVGRVPFLVPGAAGANSQPSPFSISRRVVLGFFFTISFVAAVTLAPEFLEGLVVAVLAGGAWVYFSQSVRHELVSRGYRTFAHFFRIGPMIAIMICFAGASAATTRLAKSTGDYSVLLTSDTVLSNLVLLASIERGVYLRDPQTNQNFLMPWSEIREIRRAKIGSSSRIGDFLCDWLKWCY